MKHIDRKGQVMQDIGALGVGVATLVVILAIIFVMMSQVGTQTVAQVSASNTVTNETVTWTEGAWTALTFSPNSMELSCSAVYNGTGGYSIVSTNYSCGTSGIMMTNASISPNLTTLVTYAYKARSVAFNSTEELTNATATIPGWVPLIILITLGGIILALVAVFKR